MSVTQGHVREITPMFSATLELPAGMSKTMVIANMWLVYNEIDMSCTLHEALCEANCLDLDRPKPCTGIEPKESTLRVAECLKNQQ
jgi:hypothetical protein